MRITAILILCFFFFHASGQSITGFHKSTVDNQTALESDFKSKLNPQNLDTWMKLLSARPHYVGSPYGKENADFIAKKFKEWGYDTRIDTYYVLFPFPKVRLLELTSPKKYKSSLKAVAVPGDKYTAQKDVLPSYNAFSIDGDVEAELVFVNYGIPSDYEELERMGIDVKGKIVIAKYYGSWRGIKPKLAAEKGAIGCIIYSDPKDDGYYQGDEYPVGAYKNSTGVQRGSVMDMPLYPGDVLTPGYAATKNAKRLDRKDAPTITKIPVLPISYQDAQPLLAALKGPVAPPQWRGAIPITYHIGPGPARVHLKLEFDWKLEPAYNVIATLKGSTFPDQWIMRGNHHDAWVHGANDPVSGMVSLMEEARVVGELAKEGRPPKRTIVYAAWDAEEPGLIGSTEWVEDHLSELQSKAVVYINTDGSGRGFIGAGGSHSLQTLYQEVAQNVIDPQTEVSIYERASARNLLNGGDGTIGLSALGSGSDYTPFIQHAGIASLNIGFGGENPGGEYHTIYDTYPHYTRFKDPGFKYGVALSETTGKMVLRLANSDVLPFNFSDWHATVSKYTDEIMLLLDTKRKEIDRHNMLVTKNIFGLTNDPTKNLSTPPKKASVPYIDFSPLQNEMAKLEGLTRKLSAVMIEDLTDTQITTINDLMRASEQFLTTQEGLPRRSWYKHQIYAPGFYTGYGVKTLPGVREAIEQDDWAEAQSQILVLSKTLAGFGKHLQKILDNQG